MSEKCPNCGRPNVFLNVLDLHVCRDCNNEWFIPGRPIPNEVEGE